MRRAASLLASALVALAAWWAAPAGADPGLAVTQSVLDANGNPDVIANFEPDGSPATPSWSSCPPPDTTLCTPVPGSTRFLAPGPTPAGTVFQAGAVYLGVTYTARSGPWLGTVTAIAAPVLNGTARVGATVTPAAAAWTGGWGAGYDVLGVVACRPAGGAQCVTLTGDEGVVNAPGPMVVGSWLTGWHLFAMDWRYAAGTAFAAVPIRPFVAAPAPGPTVARSTPLGPVTGPPAPHVSFGPLARHRGGRLLVAVVTCPARCHVTTRARDHVGIGTFGQATVTGAHHVTVPLGTLAHGRLDVIVTVDNGPPIHGHTTLH